MPKPQGPTKSLDLVINYLLQLNQPNEGSEYLSLTDNDIILVNSDDDESRNLYLTHCASCHGVDGNANGFNARYLIDRPTRHADASYMSLRPDNTLFDGIYAGGYILNKSHLMPAFGYSLDTKQIQDLVKYMRKLCSCTGPDWSTDNQ